MKTILEANASYLAILRKVKPSQEPYRLMKYCVTQPTDDGVLLLNTATRELMLLTEEEFAAAAENPVLRDRWFYVPEAFDERASIDMLRWVLENRQKPASAITGYTILTTTDCNARCFYCYELGRSRIPMSEETAKKTADYICAHSKGEKVSITWFGGEPLYNQAPIDIICGTLQEKGIDFSCNMVSNAYLFDEATAKKAKEHWKLQSIQVSLDGTEEVYNKSKAFIYKEGSAYQKVLENIGHLLDAGIVVHIRLNMDLYNVEDLMKLAEELARRFAGKKGLSVYAHPLFDANTSMEDQHTAQQWQLRYEALHKLEDKLRSLRLLRRHRIKNRLKLRHCMADSDNSIVVLPTGDIGACEHFSEDHFIGHLDSGEPDKALRAPWKERTAAIEACADCPCYPNCIVLKSCTTTNSCFPQLQQHNIHKLKASMLDEYAAWQKKQ